MNKKTILVITMMIAVVVIGVGIFFAINSSNENDNNNTNNNNNANNVNDNENNNNQNDDSARPAIANNIDISNYDVIYLGFPIWWGDVPKIILTLMDTYDFTGKTVIPFCTSGGSDISQSMNTLGSYEGINFIDGERFSSGTSKDEVEEWINSLNLE